MYDIIKYQYMKVCTMVKNYVLIFGVIFLITSLPVLSCTTILIGKNLTIDGSIIHAHNEDMGFSAVGRLWHKDAVTHKSNEVLNVPYVTVPQSLQSYAYWASGNAQATNGLDISKKSKPYDSVLIGMNQWGVTMSCNWMNSKEKERIEKGIRRYAIRQLILERAKTARQAVEIIGEFIDKYGQADWGGLTYNLADTSEAWSVETTSNYWVARRVKDDEIWAVANRFIIGKDYDLSSKNLIKNVIKQGWYKPKIDGRFNFYKAYGKPENMNQFYDIERENRVQILIKHKKGRLSAEDLFEVLRDRYEGTKKFTLPQSEENWREISEAKHIPRTIASNLAQSSSVAVLRSGLPIEIGAMMWYAMVNPQFSGYIPLYAGSTTIAKEYSILDSANNVNSAWWAFKNLHNQANKNYAKNYPLVNNFWMDNHHKVVNKQKQIEKKVIFLINKGEKNKAIDLLSKFSQSQSEDSLHHAKRLLDLIKNSSD
jgi:dipeptidase